MQPLAAFIFYKTSLKSMNNAKEARLESVGKSAVLR